MYQQPSHHTNQISKSIDQSINQIQNQSIK